MRAGSSPPDDSTLIGRIACGQQDALSQLYTIYRPRLRRYLWHQLNGNEAAVEDVLQEVFLAVWRSAPSYRGEAQVATWLFQIAHYQVLHLRRDRGRHPNGQLPDDGAGGRDGDWEATESHDSLEDSVLDRLTLEDALSQLRPAHREALELVFLQGFSQAEVSQILGVPPGTVKSRLSYARRALQGALRRTVYGTEGTAANG
jgi:RNA polymerase sigma-70 factor (ECF subfamily)